MARVVGDHKDGGFGSGGGSGGGAAEDHFWFSLVVLLGSLVAVIVGIDFVIL